MNDQVFSESQGSPRLPSASFARVDVSLTEPNTDPRHHAPELCHGGHFCQDAQECRRAFQCQGRVRAALAQGAALVRGEESPEFSMEELAEIVVAMVDAQVLELERFAAELEELHPAGRDALRALVLRWLERTK